MQATSHAERTIVIRPSTDADLSAMVAIYAHHVGRGIGDLGDYEAEPLDADDLKRRRKSLRRGFRHVGMLPAVAFRFGHWCDTVMVQRSLGDGDATMPGLWAGRKRPA